MCRYCQGTNVWLEYRLEAKPLGTFSLSGHQMKFSAFHWPYMVCRDCGHESRGKVYE